MVLFIVLITHLSSRGSQGIYAQQSLNFISSKPSEVGGLTESDKSVLVKCGLESGSFLFLTSTVHPILGNFIIRVSSIL